MEVYPTNTAWFSGCPCLYSMLVLRSGFVIVPAFHPILRVTHTIMVIIGHFESARSIELADRNEKMK